MVSPAERFLSISAHYLLKHFDAIATFSPDGKRREISDSDLNLLKDLLTAQEGKAADNDGASVSRADLNELLGGEL